MVGSLFGSVDGQERADALEPLIWYVRNMYSLDTPHPIPGMSRLSIPDYNRAVEIMKGLRAGKPLEPEDEKPFLGLIDVITRNLGSSANTFPQIVVARKALGLPKWNHRMPLYEKPSTRDLWASLGKDDLIPPKIRI